MSLSVETSISARTHIFVIFNMAESDLCSSLDIEPSTSNVNQEDLKIRPKAELKLQAFPPPDTSLFSPKSPSSIFTKSTLANSKKSIISCLVLCNWDNIMGPKVRHLWMSEEMDTNITLDTLVNIATHTLSGEIMRDPLDSNVDTKFYPMKEKGIVITSFIFGAMGLNDMSVHSLSVIVPYKELSRYLQLHDLCLSWITLYITKLRILLEKVCTTVRKS